MYDTRVMMACATKNEVHRLSPQRRNKRKPPNKKTQIKKS